MKIPAKRDSRCGERGAILILGIMMGAFMVAIVFHLASLGQAMLWREFVQDAADNVAYEAAVWNARGMNLIVALNIFMAIVMAILILWRLIMGFLVAVIALSAIACSVAWIPGMQWLAPACGIAPAAGTALRVMTQQDPKVTDRIYRICIALHKGQQVVASATPILGTAVSSLRIPHKTEHQPWVKYGLGLSFSLLPTLVDPGPRAPDCNVGAVTKDYNSKKLQNLINDERKKTRQPGVALRNNKGRAAYAKQMCTTDPASGRQVWTAAGAKEILQGIADMGIKKKDRRKRAPGTFTPGNPAAFTKPSAQGLAHFAMSNLAHRMGWPVSLPMQSSDDFPTLCGKGGQMQMEIIEAVLGLVGKVTHIGFLEHVNLGPIGVVWGRITSTLTAGLCGKLGDPRQAIIDEVAQAKCAGVPDQARDKCLKDTKKQAGDSFTSVGQEVQTRLDANKVQWSSVYDYAQNGNVWLQTWGIVRTTPRPSDTTDRLVRVAAWDRSAAEPQPMSPSAWVVAQAETYFDCDEDWSGCQGDAPWAMNWRARLRRVHDPADMVMDAAEQALVNKFWNVLSDALTGVVKQQFAGLQQDLGQVVGGALEQLVGQQTQKALEPLQKAYNASAPVRGLRGLVVDQLTKEGAESKMIH